MNPVITLKDLKIVKELMNKDVEVCGFLLEQEDGKLQLYIDSVGKKLQNRGTCQHSKYTKYIFHTHNIGLIAYPSPEDIYTILKFHFNNFQNNYPHRSVVFTAWGVWEICFPHKKLDLDKNWIRFLHEFIQKEFYGIYHLTDKGRGQLNRNTEMFVQQAVHNTVININNSTEAFGNAFEMYFTPWRKIKGEYSLHSV